MRQLPLLILLATATVSAHAVDLQAPGRLDGDRERDPFSKPAEVIAFAKVVPGDVILDVLGGGGYYSELLSQEVGPQGRVVLHNNQAYLPYVGEELETRFLKPERLPNVQRLQKELDQLELQAESFDKVFFVLGFHDLYYRDNGWHVDADRFVEQIKAALKPGGTLLVIDHAARPGTGKEDAQALHRIERDFVIADLERHGFRLVGSSELLANPKDPRTGTPFTPEMRRRTERFVLRFEKP